MLDYESRDCNCESQMGERNGESASARGLHRLKGLPLASAAGGMAWGVALAARCFLSPRGSPRGLGKTRRFYSNVKVCVLSHM
jgi:hypothetical protein